MVNQKSGSRRTTRRPRVSLMHPHFLFLPTFRSHTFSVRCPRSCDRPPGPLRCLLLRTTKRILFSRRVFSSWLLVVVSYKYFFATNYSELRVQRSLLDRSTLQTRTRRSTVGSCGLVRLHASREPSVQVHAIDSRVVPFVFQHCLQPRVARTVWGYLH